MKREYFYTPDNGKIFAGFYESGLWNSDMVYNANYDREEGEPELDVKDFKAYCNDVCEGIVALLADMFDDGICDSCVYDSLTSPTYYNYSTDKLTMKLNIDLDELRSWVLGDAEAKAGFNKYLGYKYTSYDGFWSFVENNVDGFFEKSWGEYSDVLIDYYLLTKIYDGLDVVDKATKLKDFTEYEYDVYDLVNDCLYQHLEPVDEAS